MVNCCYCGTLVNIGFKFFCVKRFRIILKHYYITLRELREYYMMSFKVVFPNVDGWDQLDFYQYVKFFYPNIRELKYTIEALLWMKVIRMSRNPPNSISGNRLLPRLVFLARRV